MCENGYRERWDYILKLSNIERDEYIKLVDSISIKE